MSLPLTIDIQNRILVNNTSIPAQVFSGDTLQLACSFVQPTAGNPSQYQSVDLSNTNISAQIGVINGTPEQGSFTLTDPGSNQTTQPIPFNASTSILQSMLTSSLSNNWASASVSGSTGGPWIATNGNTGAQSNMTASSISLLPGIEIEITELQHGTSAIPEIQQIALVQKPLANSANFSGNSSIMSGNITLSGLGLTEALSTNLTIQRVLQIISVDTIGHQTTLLQTPIRIAATVPLS